MKKYKLAEPKIYLETDDIVNKYPSWFEEVKETDELTKALNDMNEMVLKYKKKVKPYLNTELYCKDILKNKVEKRKNKCYNGEYSESAVRKIIDEYDKKIKELESKIDLTPSKPPYSDFSCGTSSNKVKQTLEEFNKSLEKHRWNMYKEVIEENIKLKDELKELEKEIDEKSWKGYSEAMKYRDARLKFLENEIDKLRAVRKVDDDITLKQSNKIQELRDKVRLLEMILDNFVKNIDECLVDVRLYYNKNDKSRTTK